MSAFGLLQVDALGAIKSAFRLLCSIFGLAWTVVNPGCTQDIYCIKLPPPLAFRLRRLPQGVVDLIEMSGVFSAAATHVLALDTDVQ